MSHLSKALIRSTSALLTLVLACPSALAEEPRPDLMSFAQGTLPLSINETGEALRFGMPQAVSIIDGSPAKFVAPQKPASEDDVIAVTYELPAPTVFDRFAVPGIGETPSPSQTFFRSVEVWGATESPEGPFTLLAEGQLQVHGAEDEVTELDLTDERPEVRWISLRLSGGINVEREQSFFEFSELIGNGTQQDSALSDGFDGVWSGRGVKIELAQDKASVTGCYDSNSTLSGTVDGRVLRALGEDEAGIASQFILIASEDGALRGLRSSNGAPFKPYDGDASDKAPTCLPKAPAKLGCGSVIHGIGFNFDSAEIRPSSEPVLAALHEGLSQEEAAKVQIIGHSSSEAEEAYNLDLSERRAASVAAALVDRGFEASRLSASGRGEAEPIASNDDEAGRSLNRRVEVKCSN